MPLMPKKSKSDKPGKEDQSLAIAYNVKRKASKKYAKGGPVSAKEEKRPMPEQKANDSKDVAQADHRKSNGQDKMLDNPTKEQAVMNNGRAVKPIKHPTMHQSPVFKVKLRDEEDHLQKLAEGGEINEEVSMHDAEEDMDPEMSPIRESYDSPSEEEVMADHFAEGGEVDADEEMAIDHAASIASAIMSKRRMAEGGQVDLSMNADEEPNHEDDMSFEALKKENYSESAALDHDQPEDSNEHSPEHDEEDVDDRSIVGAIRRKMKKSPISR